MWKSSLKLRQFWVTTKSGQRLACFETSRFGNEKSGNLGSQHSENLNFKPNNGNGVKNYHFLLAHCTGFTKEMWIPFIEDLFKIADQHKLTSNITATALDFRGHGDSTLNGKFSEDKVARGKEYRQIIGNWDCFVEDIETVAREILNEYQAKNLPKPIMVGVGLSKGGSSLLVAQRNTKMFDELAILEAIIHAPRSPGYGVVWEASPLSAATMKRKTEFQSFEHAQQNFKKRFADWDPRALDSYVEGLLKQDGDKVVLKMDYIFEAEVYKMGGMHRIWNDLPSIDIPVLMGFGANETSVYKGDFTNPDTKEFSNSQISPAAASVSAQFKSSPRFEAHQVEGTGHFMALERPTKLAELIYNFSLQPNQQA